MFYLGVTRLPPLHPNRKATTCRWCRRSDGQTGAAGHVEHLWNCILWEWNFGDTTGPPTLTSSWSSSTLWHVLASQTHASWEAPVLHEFKSAETDEIRLRDQANSLNSSKSDWLSWLGRSHFFSKNVSTTSVWDLNLLVYEATHTHTLTECVNVNL